METQKIDPKINESWKNVLIDEFNLAYFHTLRNFLFKEIQNDIGLPIPNHGNLELWARQGVLLLNATLTVRANQPGSHQNKGWEMFTDQGIKKFTNEKTGLVFLLW